MKPSGRESLFDKIDQARKTLGLPMRANISQIRDKYRELSKTWHPDLNQQPGPESPPVQQPEMQHQKMQQNINAAYKVLMDYCGAFQFSFEQQDIRENPSGEDFWWEHFGNL